MAARPVRLGVRVTAATATVVSAGMLPLHVSVGMRVSITGNDQQDPKGNYF